MSKDTHMDPLSLEIKIPPTSYSIKFKGSTIKGFNSYKSAISKAVDLFGGVSGLSLNYYYSKRMEQIKNRLNSGEFTIAQAELDKEYASNIINLLSEAGIAIQAEEV